jgi:hypothetical protein
MNEHDQDILQIDDNVIKLDNGKVIEQ